MHTAAEHRRRGAASDGTGERVEWVPPSSRPGTAASATACCCTAPAQVQVVMPPTPLHPQLTELLLCGHHYRRHRDALRAQGAAVYDTDGHLTRQW